MDYVSKFTILGKEIYLDFIIALTVVVILHGMLDVTILWHQTAYIYFSVLLAVGKVSTFESKFIF